MIGVQGHVVYRSFILTFIFGFLLLESDIARGNTFFDVTQGRISFQGTAEFIGPDGPQQRVGDIGFGNFSYERDNFVGSYVGTGFVMEPSGPDTLMISAEQNLRRLVDFNANIVGVRFTPDWIGAGGGTSTRSLDYFWDTPPDATARFTGSENGGPKFVTDFSPISDVELNDGWRFGNSRDSFLLMESNGEWLMVQPGGVDNVLAFGTWEATAVPEPLTIAGTGLALAFGLIFRWLRR